MSPRCTYEVGVANHCSLPYHLLLTITLDFRQIMQVLQKHKSERVSSEGLTSTRSLLVREIKNRKDE